MVTKGNKFCILTNRDGEIRLYNNDLNQLLYISLNGMDNGDFKTLKNCSAHECLYNKIPISFSIICKSNFTKIFLQFLRDCSCNGRQINLQYLLDGGTDFSFGYEFCNVNFPITDQEIFENSESVTIKFNGFCIGEVNRIFNFSKGIDIILNERR